MVIADSLYVTLAFDGAIVTEVARMGFNVEAMDDFGRGLRAIEVEEKSVNQHWEPLFGKNSPIHDHYNQLSLTVTEKQSPNRTVGVEFRLYDDGLAFRFQFLAKFVVYYSPLTFICDNPENYYGQPGLDFLREVPTVSEKYTVLAGEIGEYILVARRKDNKWYIGAMTNSQARKIDLDLSRIPGLAENVTVRLWKDAPDAAIYPTKLVYEKSETSSDSVIEIVTAPGGGFVAVIE